MTFADDEVFVRESPKEANKIFEEEWKLVFERKYVLVGVENSDNCV